VEPPEPLARKYLLQFWHSLMASATESGRQAAFMPPPARPRQSRFPRSNLVTPHAPGTEFPPTFRPRRRAAAQPAPICSSMQFTITPASPGYRKPWL